MKGFVLLAIMLLIPTVAYFQKQHFDNRLQPGLRAAVLEVLESEGVEEPEVEMTYLDAVIRGRVEDEKKRRAVEGLVAGVPGVRVASEGNQLRHFGWIELSREGGVFRASGLMPRDDEFQLPVRFGLQAGWDENLERSATVEAPEWVSDWKQFLTSYFNEPGNRSVQFRQAGLLMSGDATAGMQSDWTARASDLVGKVQVADQFTLRASRFHFPGYEALSIEAGEELERLRTRLEAVRLKFPASGVELPESESENLSALANAVVGAGEKVRYVVGGHPSSTGNVTENGQLARQRAELVVKRLEGYGVRLEQLEVVSFGVTPDAERDDEVEVLVR